MCLSTVYKNNIDEKNILMKNVMCIENNNSSLVFTDLMERKLEVKGYIFKANLVDGYVIVHVDEK